MCGQSLENADDSDDAVKETDFRGSCCTVKEDTHSARKAAHATLVALGKSISAVSNSERGILFCRLARSFLVVVGPLLGNSK